MPSAPVCLWDIGLPIGTADTGAQWPCAPVELQQAGDLADLMGTPVDEVKARMAWSRAYAGWVGDQVATVGWASQTDTWIGEIASTIRPAAGEAYIWDCRTAPAFRGRGLYRALLARILLDLSQAGVERAWIATLDQDGPGYRGVRGAGFRPVARIQYVELAGLRWWWMRRLGADPVGWRAARRVLRRGRRRERQPTRPSATPPAPVANP